MALREINKPFKKGNGIKFNSNMKWVHLSF
jgi:hypothetical protein